jgi:tRNA threonylcarbamoyladenosine modification (KEOPS) complex  Pcc1 subunit
VKGGFSVKLVADENVKIIYEALSVEAVQDAKLYLDGNTLTLRFQADSLSSLRTKVNVWLRLIKVCVDTINVISMLKR